MLRNCGPTGRVAFTHSFPFLNKGFKIPTVAGPINGGRSQFMKACSLRLVAICATVLSSVSARVSAEAKPPVAFNGATPLQWSERMADSQMARLDGKLAWKPTGGGKWDYTAGLFTLSLLKLNEHVPNPS